MRFYTVHQRWAGGDPDRNLTLVKEGFNWPAFLFGGIWALWNRMWLVGAALVIGEAALEMLPEVLEIDPAVHGVAMFALHVILGYLANDLRRWELDRRDFDEVAVVAGRGLDEAEARYLQEASRLRMGMAG